MSYDNSQISLYQMCPMAYYLQYIVEIRKSTMDDSNSAMQFGEYCHKFWEAHFNNKNVNFNDLISEYKEPEDLPQYSKEALRLFCRSYLEKNEQKDRQFVVREVENVAHIDLNGVDFIVKKDGVIEFQDNIYGLEHKTTGSLSYNYFDKYFLNSQISAQCYSVFQTYKQCSGILLNIGEIKILKRKPTGDYDGVQQVMDGYLACKFNRDFVNRNKQELEDWKDNTCKWIDKIEQSKKNNEWLKSTGSWGGTICSKCQYKELCKVSNGLCLDESVLECLYIKVDSLEYLKEGEE